LATNPSKGDTKRKEKRSEAKRIRSADAGIEQGALTNESGDPASILPSFIRVARVQTSSQVPSPSAEGATHATNIKNRKADLSSV